MHSLYLVLSLQNMSCFHFCFHLICNSLAGARRNGFPSSVGKISFTDFRSVSPFFKGLVIWCIWSFNTSHLNDRISELQKFLQLTSIELVFLQRLAACQKYSIHRYTFQSPQDMFGYMPVVIELIVKQSIFIYIQHICLVHK